MNLSLSSVIQIFCFLSAKAAHRFVRLCSAALALSLVRLGAAEPDNPEFPAPKTPQESLASIRTKPGLHVELVAAEPLVVDPVAIDFGADGKLWVVEMRDFPMGMDGRWKPGGRVKFLEDTDHDGRFDRATIFLEDVPFPTGITAWRKGVLVCAAPDILYAEDTNGDGRADRVQKLFTGFATENYQARVNSLSLGLDNWIYGANGLIGGAIRNIERLTPIDESPFAPLAGIGRAEFGRRVERAETLRSEIDIRGRDFRLNPDTGAFEPAAGLTQQGRVRDDWGNWFGCDNSTLLWHFPLPDHYLRRNPSLTAPELRVAIADDSDPNQLFPISRTLRRFNDPLHANRVTSACGLGIYRDEFLGPGFYGNAFVCEPVHNLVHRLVLSERGVTFSARRAADEQHSEFLASTDNWFRPVQVRTGPEGALWIVDMYRFVVEHPRWISADRLKELDLRAGDDKGRIYRVYPTGQTPRPIRDLTRFTAAELIRDLDESNGTDRDRIHLELLFRQDRAAVPLLRKLVRQAKRPASRVQALAILDAMDGLDQTTLLGAINDSEAVVRENAVRIGERFGNHAAIRHAMLDRVRDPSLRVSYQLALSLGEFRGSEPARALGQIALQGEQDRWIEAAVLSSATPHLGELLSKILAPDAAVKVSPEFIGQLVMAAVSAEKRDLLSSVLTQIAPHGDRPIQRWQFTAAGRFFSALERQGKDLHDLQTSTNRKLKSGADQMLFVLEAARSLSMDERADERDREAAIATLAHDPATFDSDLRRLVQLLQSPLPPRLQKAILERIDGTRGEGTARLLIAQWNRFSPTLRNSIIEVLSRREAWTADLLVALESKTILGSEVSAPNRQRLLKSNRKDLQQRAAALFALPQTGTRQALMAQYQRVHELKGNATKGASLFKQLCATCHQFRGEGVAVGPNLEALTDRSTQFLLTAILDPNAAVEDRYLNYSVLTRDGRSLSGIIADESANSLVLLNGSGARETVLRADILEIRASNVSLMPEGLEQNLNPQTMADLIAYLQGGL